jgi:hypothetical protein
MVWSLYSCLWGVMAVLYSVLHVGVLLMIGVEIDPKDVKIKKSNHFNKVQNVCFES